MMLWAEQPATFLDDAPALADAIRIFIIFVGVTLALVAWKVSLTAARYRDWEKAFGTLAFGLIVITPSISGLYRFNEPLVLWTTLTYCAGLAAGVVAMYFRVTLRWPWWRALHERRERRERPAHIER